MVPNQGPWSRRAPQPAGRQGGGGRKRTAPPAPARGQAMPPEALQVLTHWAEPVMLHRLWAQRPSLQTSLHLACVSS